MSYGESSNSTLGLHLCKVSATGVLFVILVAGLLCLFLETTRLLAADTYLAGYVTGPNNVPVTKARISLEHPNLDSPLTLFSDVQGFFRFDTVQSGWTYDISVKADGYAPYQNSSFTIDDDGPTRLSIRLAPIRSGVGQMTELATPPLFSSSLASPLTPGPLLLLLVSPTSTGALALVPGYQDDVAVPTYKTLTSHTPSFHGASAGENRYRLDGLDITNPMTGQPTLEYPMEFVKSMSVASSGFSVMEGDATGAQVDLRTPYGDNRFRGNIFLYVTPYQQSSPPRIEPQPNTTYSVERNDVQLLDSQFGVNVGGFLVRDKIWFALGAAPRIVIGQTTRTFGESVSEYDNLQWQLPAFGRLTFNFTPDQTLQVAGYGLPGEYYGVIRDATDTSTGLNGDASTFLGQTANEALASTAHYAIRLRRYRTRADLLVGGLLYYDQTIPDQRDQDLDGRPDGEQALTIHTGAYSIPGTSCGNGDECSPVNYFTGGHGAINDYGAKRVETRLQVTHHLTELAGRHQISWGGSFRYDVVSHFPRYTEGVLITDRSEGEVSNTEYQRILSNDPTAPDSTTLLTSFHGRLSGAFLRDLWNPVKKLTLDYGVRVDREQVETEKSVVAETAATLSPRLEVNLAHTTLGSGAVTLGYAKHTMELPTWLADAAALTPRTRTYYEYDAQSDVVEDVYSASSPWPQASSSINYLATNQLQPISQHDLYSSFAHQFGNGLSSQLLYLRRNLDTTIEPLAYPDGLIVLANPGDVPNLLNSETYLEACFRTTSSFTDEKQTYCYTEPTRLYQAFEFRLNLEPQREKGLWLSASYTFGTLSGDYPGPTAHQPGAQPLALETLYNQANLTDDTDNQNRYGPLPADRTHKIRGYAVFSLLKGLKVGLGVQAQSGAPLNVLAPAPGTYDGLVFVYPRGAAGRGPWRIDQQVSLSYTITLREQRAIDLGTTVFNPLNLDASIRQDERYVLNTAQPVTQGSFTIVSPDTLSCLDIDTLTAGDCTSNPAFLGSLESTQPLGVRVVLRYRF